KEAELQGLIDRKEAQFNNSVQLLRNLQTAQAQLSTTIKTQAETLVKAQHNEELAQTQLDQIEREEESIAAVIARAQAGQNVRTYASGRLAWPLHGVLEQGFGPTPYKFEAPITYQGVRYPHFHTGIDIAAPAGSPIAAAANGQVIVTGYDAYGYGNYLIIAHNPTLATLYGHMSRLAVGKGLVVKQGQTIGFEGSTGNSTGPHLHFEVRVNGNFVNPLGYL
ncbi:MAG: M23 family metallopeptidase, partial [Chloroflexota bacterium]|nr:M23 family metallopeptidase [Chloroflexota bacterium]